GQLAPRRGELGRCRVVGQVHRLEVDISNSERARHLDRPRTREVPQRVAGDAELESFVGRDSARASGHRPAGNWFGAAKSGEAHATHAECRDLEKSAAGQTLV